MGKGPMRGGAGGYCTTQGRAEKVQTGARVFQHSLWHLWTCFGGPCRRGWIIVSQSQQVEIKGMKGVNWICAGGKINLAMQSAISRFLVVLPEFFSQPYLYFPVCKSPRAGQQVGQGCLAVGQSSPNTPYLLAMSVRRGWVWRVVAHERAWSHTNE
jgi:hypothetical protein